VQGDDPIKTSKMAFLKRKLKNPKIPIRILKKWKKSKSLCPQEMALVMISQMKKIRLPLEKENNNLNYIIKLIRSLI